MTESRAATTFGADPRAESRVAEPRGEKETLARATVLTVTVGLSAAAWAAWVWQLDGMDMEVGTELGSFGSFTVTWALMMAAMMLPGLAPHLLRRARADGGVRSLPMFVASYLGVWALVGVAVYAVYRPHGSSAAAVMVIAAGGYELTPLKRHFRHRCQDGTRSGFDFGVSCVGTSAGHMLVMAALGIMSITWMGVTTGLVLAQKLVPPKAVIDVPLALGIVGLGVLILIAPSAVPGLTPTM